MKIALFANETKGEAPRLLQQLSSYLKRRGVDVPIESVGDAGQLDKQSLNSCDFLVSIGGDGSILHLLHRFGIPHSPIIGVNMGSLGFLADIAANDMENGFEAIFKGAYHVIDRVVIEGRLSSSSSDYFAVNEVAVYRGDYPHIVDLTLHVDGQFVNTFSADGVIVSTPCGSTAYSLAAGGPILTPSVGALVLTPICPHTISNRPIVFMPKESIEIGLSQGPAGVEVAFDGQAPGRLSLHEKLHLRVSPHPFRLVTLAESDFFSTLRTKLGWAGSLRKL